LAPPPIGNLCGRTSSTTIATVLLYVGKVV